jgi:hypothetical protein
MSRRGRAAGSARRRVPVVHRCFLFGLDHEIDLQFVLDPHCTAEGTDRLNAIIGLSDRCGADVSSVHFVDG